MKKVLLPLLMLLAAVAYGQDKHAMKLSPHLQSQKASRDLEALNIFWIAVNNVDSFERFLSEHGLNNIITAKRIPDNVVIAKCSRTQINFLLDNYTGIRFIDIPRVPKEELAINSFDNSLNAINKVQHKFAAIDGDGLTVSVKENRFDTADIDFKGRFRTSSLMSPIFSGHASIMATMIAGAGNSYYTGRGVAPAALISSSNFSTLLPDAPEYYTQNNVSVQNHSYGTGIENYYGIDAAAYDQTSFQNRSLLHIFSSGNSGNQTGGSGPYTGVASLANITGSFKMSKNSISVGAVDSFSNVAFLSSKGPAHDGRIKPELTAFGEDGSSGAAALVSGSALLLQHYYKLNFGTLPPASLTKAILVNSATDIFTAGPDYSTGYGLLNTYGAVKAIQGNTFITGSINNGSAQSYPLVMPANTKRLKVTLCWTDPPAMPNVTRALVNDLDLTISNNSNTQSWQPWVLRTFPHRDSLLLPATRNRDSLNNVEQITIDDPAAGAYDIIVQGFSVQGAQEYSIAWQIDTANSFDWSRPAAVDPLRAAASNVLRWQSNFTNGTGQLQYALNNSNNWQTISNSVELNTRYFKWIAPDTVATVQLRMLIGGDVYATPVTVLTKEIQLNVGFNCADSALLYWNSIAGASMYRVFKLGNRYLEPVTNIADTFIVVPKSPAQPVHYSVAPLIGPQTGIRSFTVNYTAQGTGCYIRSFLAEPGTNNNALLMLTIGTSYQIKEIVIEKLTGSSITTVQKISNFSTLSFSITDNTLLNGANRYRAKIVLQSGAIIYSDIETVYFFRNADYLLFPNPLPAGGGSTLQVLSKDLLQGELSIFNAAGQQVYSRLLSSPSETIGLQQLPRGLYVVRIRQEGKPDYRGKLIIQ